MNLPDQRLRIVILGDSLTTENTCYSLFLKNGVYFSMYTLPMNSELSRQSMSPAAESDADHFRGICVWQFYRENKLSLLFFSSAGGTELYCILAKISPGCRMSWQRENCKNLTPSPSVWLLAALSSGSALLVNV